MTEFVNFTFPAAGRSTDRTLPVRLTDAINVKDWGAVGDGVADDTEAIARALAWNTVLTSTGDPILSTTHTYSGAFRLAPHTWSGGTITSTTTEPHGWTIGVPFTAKLENNWNGGLGGNTALDGNRTITPTSTTTFTFALASDPRPFGYYGSVRPVVTAATWVANVVELTFSAPHRLAVGVICTVASFAPIGINGSRTITSVTSTTLQFAATGSGSVTSFGTCKPEPWITVGTVPAGINVTQVLGLASHNPEQPAQYFQHTVQNETASKIWFSNNVTPTAFQCDIPVGTELQITPPHRGVIFFPPGEYKITEPIYLTDIGLTFVMRGVPGKSVIRGNFADYLFNQELKSAGSGPTLIEKMKFVNDHASGKGLRLCQVNTQVRDCVFEANEGLSYASLDYVAAIAFSVVVSGCRFNPGTQPSGSRGIMLATNNASVLGNHFSGLAEGIRGQSFGKTIAGNVFEDNVIGYNSGFTPLGANFSNGMQGIMGNTFINNGTGMLPEPVAAEEWRATISKVGRVRRLDTQRWVVAGECCFEDWTLQEHFQQAAWSGATTTAHVRYNITRGVRALDSGAVSFLMPLAPSEGTFIECNKAQLHTFAQLRGRKIQSIVWSGGTVTVTTANAHNFIGGFGALISGVTIGGSANNKYNGAVSGAAAATGTTLTFSLAADPGASGDANTGIITTMSFAPSVGRPIRAASWAGGETTYRTWGPHDMSGQSGATVSKITVGGSATNGYNATFTSAQVTVVSSDQFKVTMADPGTADAASMPASADLARDLLASVSITNHDRAVRGHRHWSGIQHHGRREAWWGHRRKR